MKSQSLTPIAIVLAGIIIALAIISSNTSAGPANVHNAIEGGERTFGNNNSASAENIRPVDSSDYVFGSREAKVFMIEYSDFECPFCSQLHPTLKRVVEERDGEVAWVFRHFPLTSIHSRAMKASIASLCVGELGGNDSFWSFSDGIFENQRQLGDELYLRLASELGIEENSFQSCMNSGKHEATVQADLDNAVASGGRGTPFTVIIDSEGNTFPFAGALPYEQISSVVNQALVN